ncbi:MAG TPA: Crp/Fnr family transcriptional regulator [Puia sp.]|nr:Crp/Fnr family transcriptional regulator [Puia sp.]
MLDLLALLEDQAPLSPELRNHLQQIIHVEEFPKKAHLLKAGHLNTKVYFIIKGLVRCYVVDSEGKEESIWFLKEGDVIYPREGFDKQTMTDESMQALEDCFVYSINFSELEIMYKQYPELNFHGRRVAVRYSLLWYTLFKQLKMKSAQERYQFLLENFPELVQRVQGQYLASFLGISHGTLSRIRGII